jgi:2-oxoglutarate ferredoxin oxidoreductase subunit alpha
VSLDINIMSGGAAGQGVQSVGFILGKTFSRGGYYVFADQHYESRIRGGHNFFRIRAKDTPVNAIAETVDILIALNEESIYLHEKELSDKGIIVFDDSRLGDRPRSPRMRAVPLVKLAEEQGGNRIMSNTVAVGAALGLVEYDFDILASVLKEHFGETPLGEANVKAARAGYDYVMHNFPGASPFGIKRLSQMRRLLITGNDAISMGAIAAGCKFLAAYPMTPTTPILEFLAAQQKNYPLVVIHSEDEIAAINMAIGAAYTGVRAMTATSGSGFCLMTEGLSLAGMTETPVVIVEGQRPGPATGLPTHTEQGDLEFMVHAAHGEFPRAVLAPSSAADAFWLTIKAFNLAEIYQIPVIILADEHLGSSFWSVEPFDLSQVTIDRGDLFQPHSEEETRDYQRHRFTPSGISPRAFPGKSQALVVTDADEHDEMGHLNEDAGIRQQMVEKRQHKMEGLRSEIAPPEKLGPETADLTLVGWGSTRGALQEAMASLSKEGRSVNLIHFTELWPFPPAAARILGQCRRTVLVESNYTGQLGHLIRAETGVNIEIRIVKYDGRPLTPAYISRRVKEEVAWA